MKFILASLILMLSCKSIGNKNLKTTREVSFETVSSGVLYVNDLNRVFQGNFTASKLGDWEAVLNSMDKSSKGFLDKEKARINFSNYMLVGVFDTIRTTGGFEIEIEEIFDEKKGLKVLYATKKPAPFDKVVMVVTQPYHIVKTKKTKKTVTFIRRANR